MTKLLQQLTQETGIRPLELLRIMTSAPVRYKSYVIPKRNGGVRKIAQPAREVKVVQRALISTLLSQLPVHDAATAYRAGLSILSNAQPHAKSGPILKVDFRDFFPSIRARDWISYCRRTNCLADEEDILHTSRLLFHRESITGQLRLAIGAPSSPILSNILMHEFDSSVVSAVEKDHVIYTRYADDLTFSAPRTGHLTGVLSRVARIVRELKSPSLCINDEKTTYVTKKYHRVITGLTLANDGRVTIGRDKKREIHAAVYYALTGRLGIAETQALAGLLAYVNAVEPAFLDKLRTKHGAAVISKIQKTVIRGSKSLVRPPIITRP